MVKMRFVRSFAALSLLYHSLLCYASPTVPSLIARLKSSGLSMGTQIFFPSDPNYDEETTQRFTSYNAPTYVASIKPALPSDVSKIVGQ